MNSPGIKKKNIEMFDEWSKTYDRSLLQDLVFKRSHDMFLDCIKKYKTNSDALRVLDVGCGTGEFLNKISKFSDDIELHGIDLSPKMLDIAASKLEGVNASFKVGDVENLPYDEDTFNIITCSHSFHHYPDQIKAIAEMSRVMKPDGKLMIIDGSRENLLGKIIFGIFIKRLEKNVYHMRASEFKEAFSVNGLEDVTQTKFSPLIPLLFTVGMKN